MSDHLSLPILNALADGELSSDELAETNRHLAACQSCASNAFQQSMLKSATAKAGSRYTPAPGFEEQLLRQIRETPAASAEPRGSKVSQARTALQFYGLASAVALMVVCLGVVLVRESTSRAASSANAATVTEIYDQHIATLASNALPQVVSSDRHTVKPWFQGKLAFSFNLPEDLPSGTTLDGANFTYVRKRPAAQLLYSIGNIGCRFILNSGCPRTQPTPSRWSRPGTT